MDLDYVDDDPVRAHERLLRQIAKAKEPRFERPSRAYALPRAAALVWPQRLRADLPRCPSERAVVKQLAGVTVSLAKARGRTATIRDLASRSGLSTSVVQDVFDGSRWPTFKTLGCLAHVLDLRLALEALPTSKLYGDDRGRRDQPRDLASPQIQAAAGSGVDPCAPQAMAALWNDQSIEMLFWRMDSNGITTRQAARWVRCQEGTLSRLRHSGAQRDGRWLSTPLLMGLAHVLDLRLMVRRGSQTHGEPSGDRSTNQG